MSKHDRVGIDVSKDWFDVERVNEGGEVDAQRFENTEAGHRKVCQWLSRGGRSARVVVEATGSYHRKLVQALVGKKGVEVMVANPMAVKNFRRALLQRASTDATSAKALREFAQRMKFVPWKPASKASRDLRALARRAETLTVMRATERNHLHAARVGKEPASVIEDIRANIVALGKRLERIREQARKTIGQEAGLEKAYALMCSIKGVGTISAIAILAELAQLPEGLGVRQWVAYAGLDPRPIESGTSVKMARRISKVGNIHLRRGLYMPALVAMRHNPNVREFAQHLSAKGKSKLVVVVAVMRKLLHSIYGMLKSGSGFDPEKFYCTAKIAA